MRASVVVLAAFIGAFTVAAMGVGRKDSCSAAVGSVDVGAGRLALPCDLVGVVSIVAGIAIAGLALVGLVLKGQQSWRSTVLVLAAIGAVTVSAAIGLTSVPLA